MKITSSFGAKAFVGITTMLVTVGTAQANIFLSDSFSTSPSRPAGGSIHGKSVEFSSIGSRTWTTYQDSYNGANANASLATEGTLEGTANASNGYSESGITTPFSLSSVGAANLISFKSDVLGAGYGIMSGGLSLGYSSYFGRANGGGFAASDFTGVSFSSNGYAITLEGGGASKTFNLGSFPYYAWGSSGKLKSVQLDLDRVQKTLSLSFDGTLLGSITMPSFVESSVQLAGYYQSGWLGRATYDNFEISSPVPEPASMFALGLGALALVRRRKGGAK